MEKRNGSVLASVSRCGCIELERLTRVRAEGFAAYLKARHLLGASASDKAGHEEVLLGFRAARQAFRLNQRKWEEHVAEHHLG